MRYIKKEREVLEGDITNKWHPLFPPIEFAKKHDSVIILPHTAGPNPKATPEEVRERYQSIKRAQAAGIVINVEVIRVVHMTPAFLNNPRMIGTVVRFLFSPYVGYNDYRPILVRFTTSNNSYSDFPFNLEEIELLEKAKEIIGKENPHIIFPANPQEKLLDNIWKSTAGVIPFRSDRPTRMNLPHRELDE